MSNPYFSKMGVIGYDIDGSGQKIAAVDLLQRLKMRKIYSMLTSGSQTWRIRNVFTNLIFYTYDVKDGETPETIAHKLYGDSGLHWIILLANDIIDPVYDWPMSYINLIATIHALYDTPYVDGLVYAYQTLDHYQDQFGNTIDETTYHSLPASQRSAIMIYDQMINDNEAKRQILLLDANYVNQVDAEADALLNSFVLS